MAWAGDAVTSARLLFSCQEQHTGEPPAGSREPSANLDSPGRQGGPKRSGMLPYPSPSGSIVRQDQKARDSSHAPPSFAGYLLGEAGLSIERPKHGLEIRHDGLDLDDQERPCRRVEGEDIDSPALAPDVEGHLGRDLPFDATKLAQHQLGQVRVSHVQQPIETFALPEQPHVDGAAKRRRHSHQNVDWDAVGSAAFDTTDDAPRNARRGGEALLRPPSAAPECPHREPEPDRVHLNQCRDEHSPGAYHRLHPRSPAGSFRTPPAAARHTTERRYPAPSRSAY